MHILKLPDYYIMKKNTTPLNKFSAQKYKKLGFQKCLYTFFLSLFYFHIKHSLFIISLFPSFTPFWTGVEFDVKISNDIIQYKYMNKTAGHFMIIHVVLGRKTNKTDTHREP